MAALAELESNHAAEHVAAEALLQAEQLRQLQEDLVATRQRQVCCRLLTTAERVGVCVLQTVHIHSNTCPFAKTKCTRNRQCSAADLQQEKVFECTQIYRILEKPPLMRFGRQLSSSSDGAHTQEEEAAATAARFRELEAALAEAEASLADEADALPQLEAQLAAAQGQVGMSCDGCGWSQHCQLHVGCLRWIYGWRNVLPARRISCVTAASNCVHLVSSLGPFCIG